jgi:type II secretory pathway pseudopilin PulG
LGSTRFWLLLFAGQLGILVLLAVFSNGRPVATWLQYLGIVCIVGIFLSVAPVMVKSFVAGQVHIGNGHLPMVRGLQRHEVAVILTAWAMMGAALAMAMPTIMKDIRAERAENAAADAAAAAGATPEAMAAAMSAPPPTAVPLSESQVDAMVATPGPGSPERAAILDALRQRLKSKSRFRVDHIRTAAGWAFVRATEVVTLDGNEEQETDLTVAALLELPSGSTTGWWRIADYWTLPENDRKPHADFTRRVRQRITAERLPPALLPDDL